MPKKLDVNQIIKRVDKSKFKLLSTEYINNYSNLKFECIRCGNIFTETWNNFIKRKHCPECNKTKNASVRKLKLEDIKRRLKDINPDIEILSEDYINSKTKLKCLCLICGDIWMVDWNHLSRNSGCRICRGGVRYTIDKVRSMINNENIELLSETYKNSGTPLHWKCKIDGYEWFAKWEGIQSGNGCPVCSGRAVSDVNRLSILRPDLIKYFKDKRKPENLTLGANQKVDLICPDCKLEKSMVVAKLVDRGFSCNRCGDGVSIPEKFMFNTLTHLGVEFKYQEYFDWLKDRFYDFYIPSLNMIIEVHGRQHYEASTRGRSFEEEKENDILKESVAKNNYIKHYIVINAYHTEFDVLQKNITNSLSNFFNFSNIDWNDVGIKTSTSLMKLSWDAYNNGILIPDIAKEMKLHYTTIKRYINVGDNLGIVNYKRRLPSEFCCKEVEQYNLDGVFIKKFKSITEASLEVGVSGTSISSALHGRQTKGGNFIWKFPT